MGKTGPGWKGTDSVIILFKNTLPSLLRAIQTKARAPSWPPTPAPPSPEFSPWQRRELRFPDGRPLSVSLRCFSSSPSSYTELAFFSLIQK